MPITFIKAIAPNKSLFPENRSLLNLESDAYERYQFVCEVHQESCTNAKNRVSCDFRCLKTLILR